MYYCPADVLKRAGAFIFTWAEEDGEMKGGQEAEDEIFCVLFIAAWLLILLCK